jgi:hypothetical protein
VVCLLPIRPEAFARTKLQCNLGFLARYQRGLNPRQAFSATAKLLMPKTI